MIRALGEQVRRLGVVVTFLALFFAAANPMEALACAAEGCGAACIEQQAEGAVASDAAGGATSDDCTGCGCVCSIGHCGHAFSTPVAIETARVPSVTERNAPAGIEPFTSASVQGLERPPRA